MCLGPGKLQWLVVLLWGFMWVNLTEVGGKKGQGGVYSCQLLLKIVWYHLDDHYSSLPILPLKWWNLFCRCESREVGITIKNSVAASSESATVRLFGIWMIPGNWLMLLVPTTDLEFRVYFARCPKIASTSAKKYHAYVMLHFNATRSFQKTDSTSWHFPLPPHGSCSLRPWAPGLFGRNEHSGITWVWSGVAAIGWLFQCSR